MKVRTFDFVAERYLKKPTKFGGKKSQQAVDVTEWMSERWKGVNVNDIDAEALRRIRAADVLLQERWPEAEEPREWEGVTMNAHGRLTELHIHGPGYAPGRCVETLDPAIGSCLGLTELNLEGNSLKDINPLRWCVALTKLDLSLNNMEDINPLGSCVALTTLKL